MKNILLGIACASALAAASVSAQPTDADIDLFLDTSRPNADWDVSNVRNTCWAIIDYKSGPRNSVIQVSLTHDFATKSGELRAYSKGDNKPLLRDLNQGVGEYSIYFASMGTGSWIDKVPLDVGVNHREKIYTFSAPIEIGSFLAMFEQLPGFQVHTTDRKPLFSGYSGGNADGVAKMRERLKAGGWTAPAR